MKYLPALPLVSWKASTITIVEKTPDSRLTAIGVPQRLEKMPKKRGARAVEAGDGLRAVGAHDPRRPAREQRPG